MLLSFHDRGLCTGAVNMAADEEQARLLARGYGSPSLAVYGWNPPAISLGWHQELEEVDGPRAAQAGIDVVRRPTGGRAILHSDEVTYCVVMPADGRNIQQAYADISRALLRSLEILGIRAELERTQPHFPSLYREDAGSVCFSSAGRYEIKCNGRKLVGSAQRRYAAADGSEVVLQHGSILLGPDHRRIVDFLRVRDENIRHRLRTSLESQTTDLKELLGPSVERQAVVTAVRRGFEEAWGVECAPSEANSQTEVVG